MVGVISHFVLLGLVVACHGQAYLKNCVNDTDPRPTPDVSIRILPSTTIIDRSTVWITCEASAQQSSDDQEIQPLPPTRIEIYVGLYSVNTCTGSPVTRCSYRILSFFYGIPRLVACVASAAPGQCRYTYRIINIVKRNEGCPDPTGRCPTQPEDSCNDDFDCLPTQRCCLQATCRQDKICLRAEITKPSTTRATTTPTTEATTTPTTEATTTPTTEATTTPTTLTTENVATEEETPSFVSTPTTRVTTTEETTPSEKITVAPLTDASTAIPTTKEEHPEKTSSTTSPPDLSTVATTTTSTTMVPTHSKRKGDKDNSDDEDSDDEDDDDDDDDDSDENEDDDDDD